MNVLLFRDLDAAQVEALRAAFPACEFRQTTSPATLETWLAWPDVIYGNAPAALLRRAPRLRWLQIVSSGFDDYLPLRDTAVKVTTARGVHAPIIAQHVLLMILLFTRGQLHFARQQQARIWDRRPAIPQELRGQTVGLLGYGEIGRALAPLLRPLDVRVVAARKSDGALPPELDALFPISAVDDLLAQSDHLVVTLPLTDETRGFLDAARIARLKRGAVLHNISRGEIVDESALLARLHDGSLGGAALDVFAEEPLPPEHPFWSEPNVVVTPHLAGHHRDLGRLTLARFTENLRRRLAGEPLVAVADFARGY
jgi:phosphoglycerate dehydrogenase-like enzyme